jgi:hypothetical protein
MNEPVNPTFATEQVEKPEIERITEQLQTYKASIDGKLVGVVIAMIDQYLKAGLVSTQDLTAMAALSEEFNKAQIDYQTFVGIKQRRLQELQQEQMLKNNTDTTEKFREYEKRLAEEIEESRKAKKELAKVMAQLEEIQANTTEEPAKPVEKTRAFDVARSLNPLPTQVEEPIMPQPDPMESWEEPEIKSLDDVTPEEWDQAVKSIKEVEVDEEVVEEEVEVEEVKDELDLFEEQLIAEEKAEEEQLELALSEEEPELRIAEEDEQTQPNFTKPIVSGGNAPNLQNIPTYDSEEEMLAAAQAKIDAKKEEVEEEYEEITIPSEAELNAMTKADILESAEELGFANVDTADTKKVMIQNFVADANAFIQSLEDSGDLVSANIESDEDGDTDRQDGGYF